MFNPAAFENSRPDGVPVLQIVNGKHPGPGDARRFVPLKVTHLKGQIVGPLASLRLIQTFGYTSAQCNQVLEAAYRFPLPGDAAVTSVGVRFGNVEIRTQLKERGQAEADYAEARQKGQQAILATRESPDVLTLKIAGLRPDEEIVVESEYVQLARSEGAGWSLRIPLTTAPRYMRSDELTARHAQGEPLALYRDPGHRFRLDLTLHDASGMESPTYPLNIQQDERRTGVCLREGDVLPDRDCVLTWRAKQEAERPGLAVQIQADRSSTHDYFLALVAPPATHDRGTGVAREVILLVDHSGSMQGAKWQAADWAVERFLGELTEPDHLALGLFHNTTRWFDKTPRSANAQCVANAVAFLKQHRDTGGTELGVALEQSLDLPRHGAEMARHVLVITDGQVTDAGRILQLADQESKRADRRRISILCIDAAPNSLLATELAERGGGVARFVTSAPEEEDITSALDQVLADWSEPVLRDLRLEVNQSLIEGAGRLTRPASDAGWSAIDLGDLPAGRPIWVTGRLPHREAGDLTFRIATGKGHKVADARPSAWPADDVRCAFPALFGARRIRGLEYLMHATNAGDQLAQQLQYLGYDPTAILSEPSTQPPKVYAENVREVSHAVLRKLVVQESLDYGLVSAETAFIAERSEDGKPIEGMVVVANALPTGWVEWPGSRLAGSRVVRAKVSLQAVCSVAPGDTDDVVFAMLATNRTAAPIAKARVVFSEVPRFDATEVLLFDSDRNAKRATLPDRVTLNRLELSFPHGTPDVRNLDPGICLLVYVDDLASPRVRVRVVDLVRQGGARPINIRREAGQLVRLVLVDPAGAWKDRAPKIEVALGCV